MNPDHALLLAFARSEQAQPQPVHSNPLAQDLGAELQSANAQTGELVLAFTPGGRFMQGNGAVQGGIVAAMLDFAIAYAVLLQLPPERSAVTAALDVQFMRTARAGRYIARAQVQRLGATLAFARAELLREGDDRPVAAASATLPVLRLLD